MSTKVSGFAAAGNIILCVIVALWLVMPASMGGFNATAIRTYAAIALSLAASFYLLTKRRELNSTSRSMLTALMTLFTVLALSPVIVALSSG